VVTISIGIKSSKKLLTNMTSTQDMFWRHISNCKFIGDFYTDIISVFTSIKYSIFILLFSNCNHRNVAHATLGYKYMILKSLAHFNITQATSLRVFGLEVALVFFYRIHIKKHVFLDFKDVVYTLKWLYLWKKIPSHLQTKHKKKKTGIRRSFH
jgi:hypothetical protein